MKVIPPRCALVALALWLGPVSVAGAERPIRMGATYSQTGSLAPMGQNMMRGSQLCIKHANDKGGLLGRRIELLVEDDRSDGPTAAALYEKLITRDKVDAILGLYSSPLTEAIADVIEKHRMPIVANAVATSIFKKGRKFVFMGAVPAERFLEGLIDLAANRGLRRVAIIHEDTLLQQTIAQGAQELARRRGLQLVLAEAYPKGTTDFGGILGRVKAASPDVLAAAAYDVAVITRVLKDLGINPKMFGSTVESPSLSTIRAWAGTRSSCTGRPRGRRSW